MTDHNITVSVRSEYLPEQSDLANNRYVFSYHVTINNHGNEAAKLLSRHWIITDGEEQQQEVKGEGVIGEQPNIAAGDEFSYTSGTVLPTPVGSMHGSYSMITENGDAFVAKIEPFTLASPSALH